MNCGNLTPNYSSLTGVSHCNHVNLTVPDDMHLAFSISLLFFNFQALRQAFLKCRPICTHQRCAGFLQHFGNVSEIFQAEFNCLIWVISANCMTRQQSSTTSFSPAGTGRSMLGSFLFRVTDGVLAPFFFSTTSRTFITGKIDEQLFETNPKNDSVSDLTVDCCFHFGFCYCCHGLQCLLCFSISWFAAQLSALDSLSFLLSEFQLRFWGSLLHRWWMLLF